MPACSLRRVPLEPCSNRNAISEKMQISTQIRLAWCLSESEGEDDSYLSVMSKSGTPMRWEAETQPWRRRRHRTWSRRPTKCTKRERGRGPHEEFLLHFPQNAARENKHAPKVGRDISERARASEGSVRLNRQPASRFVISG